MGATSIWHWLIVALVVSLLFGSKRIPGLMQDLAGGIRAFKRGLADAEHTETVPVTDQPADIPSGPSERTSSHG